MSNNTMFQQMTYYIAQSENGTGYRFPTTEPSVVTLIVIVVDLLLLRLVMSSAKLVLNSPLTLL